MYCKSNIQELRNAVCLISNKSLKKFKQGFLIIKINDGRKKRPTDKIKSSYYLNVYNCSGFITSNSETGNSNLASLVAME